VVQYPAGRIPLASFFLHTGLIGNRRSLITDKDY
jgi:hypothetical protein